MKSSEAIIEAHANRLLDRYLEAQESCCEDEHCVCEDDPWYDEDERDFEVEAYDRAERRAERDF